jgi:hypothetical protein
MADKVEQDLDQFKNFMAHGSKNCRPFFPIALQTVSQRHYSGQSTTDFFWTLKGA